MGDRRAHLRAAREFLLARHEGSGPALLSGLYETDPVDCPPGSPAFLNAVVEITTTRPPAELLADLAALERGLGRPARRERHAPRTLDADILYAGDLVIATAGLVVPHPRMAQRRFVLQPLAEIRPDFTPPGQTRTVAQLLALLPDAGDVRPVETAW